ncbi:acyl-CoA carboxylase subunit beta [Conexibacter sp. DBS9H8]|uniref:acyl-CoA carboxylase subunit beta n=1 Tax=Conexibacter sp. DBS9H8 TaxID=2937801 RepID=UPI00200F541E|nr:acyl-CoA carboxylase subunit beta [Conexibacter sp. DBS9H8]
MSSLKLAPRPAETLGPIERLETLCDPGSLHFVRGDVVSRRMGGRAVAGDGVIGATGRVDGRPVACFAQDRSFLGGSLGEAHADTICRVLRLAGHAQIPVVGFVESAGARLQEGVAALCGYGRIFHAHTQLSGVVPQISVICGASAGGGSYAPALTDFVVMTRRASMFLTGPGIVREVTGEDVDAATLGGPKVHERNGVCQIVCEDDVDAALTVRDLLDHLPQHAEASISRWPAAEPRPGRPDAAVPDEPRKVYDIRDVIPTLVDGGRLLELNGRWGRNMVTAMARIDGHAVGVVANNPRYLGGVMDADSATKAARFVRTCDLFGVPLLVLVDTPGFLPGTRQEGGGVIRHGAKLVHAFAAATVPRITVVLRKAFGGAFIAMNSRDLGADLVLAWPTAEIGVMGPQQAVDLVHRREIAAAADPTVARDRFARAYAAEHLSAASAAAEGVIDEIITPSQTRARVIAALETLSTPRRPLRPNRNIPL